MMVTPLGPRETIDWFEQADHQNEILCFMITANPDHRRILTELAQNYVDADTALGSKVAFILFGEGDTNRYAEVGIGYGERRFLPGEPIQPRVLRDYSRKKYFGQSGLNKEWPNFNDLENYQAEVLATETARGSVEWMNLLKIRREALPVLCAFVKGSDPAVISLGEKLDASKVLKVFGRLADIAERDSEKALTMTFNIEAKMERAIALGKEIEKLERSFIEHMEAITNKFKASPEEKKSLAEFLSRKLYTTEALDHALAKCKFTTVDGFNSNTTVKGARNKLNKLVKAIADLEEIRPREDTIVSLSDALDAINNRRQETARLVSELSEQGINAKSVEKQSLGVTYDKYTDRINKTTTLLEKLGKFVGLVKGAGLIAQILK